MKNSPHYTKLSAEKLANLFLQLAHLESSGVPAQIAFGLIADTDAQVKKHLYAIQTQIKAGKSIAAAGFKTGLFNEIQRAVLHAAESAGTLAVTYKQLADYYDARAKRLRKIKSRSYYPAVLFTLSLFLQPLPALVGGAITGTDYVLLSVGRLAAIIFMIYLVLNLPSFFKRIGLKAVIDSLQLQTPWVSDWVINRQLNDFYRNLSMLLAAGLPFSQALPKLVASIPNSRLQAQFNSALAMARTGKSVTEILSSVKSIQGTTVIQVINSAEHSGSLASALQHFAGLEADNLHLQDDMLAEWLPRLIYLAVVVWIAKSLIGF
jgi:type II secretory pathway component PulF